MSSALYNSSQAPSFPDIVVEGALDAQPNTLGPIFPVSSGVPPTRNEPVAADEVQFANCIQAWTTLGEAESGPVLSRAPSPVHDNPFYELFGEDPSPPVITFPDQIRPPVLPMDTVRVASVSTTALSDSPAAADEPVKLTGDSTHEDANITPVLESTLEQPAGTSVHKGNPPFIPWQSFPSASAVPSAPELELSIPETQVFTTTVAAGKRKRGASLDQNEMHSVGACSPEKKSKHVAANLPDEGDALVDELNGGVNPVERLGASLVEAQSSASTVELPPTWIPTKRSLLGLCTACGHSLSRGADVPRHHNTCSAFKLKRPVRKHFNAKGEQQFPLWYPNESFWAVTDTINGCETRLEFTLDDQRAMLREGNPAISAYDVDAAIGKVLLWWSTAREKHMSGGQSSASTRSKKHPSERAIAQSSGQRLLAHDPTAGTSLQTIRSSSVIPPAGFSSGPALSSHLSQPQPPPIANSSSTTGDFSFQYPLQNGNGAGFYGSYGQFAVPAPSQYTGRVSCYNASRLHEVYPAPISQLVPTNGATNSQFSTSSALGYGSSGVLPTSGFPQAAVAPYPAGSGYFDFAAPAAYSSALHQSSVHPPNLFPAGGHAPGARQTGYQTCVMPQYAGHAVPNSYPYASVCAAGPSGSGSSRLMDQNQLTSDTGSAYYAGVAGTSTTAASYHLGSQYAPASVSGAIASQSWTEGIASHQRF